MLPPQALSSVFCRAHAFSAQRELAEAIAQTVRTCMVSHGSVCLGAVRTFLKGGVGVAPHSRYGPVRSYYLHGSVWFRMFRGLLGQF